MKNNGIALFLPGGGAAGAMYQIAVLAALEDAVEGLNANAFDLFMGASSGASVSTDLIRLYKALGGGWSASEFLSAPPPTAP